MSEPTPPAPELSIVVPAYNERARISLTLAKILDWARATHPGTEVIVVDDGSTDDTAALVESFVERYPELRLLKQPRNRGKGAAVRRGMLAARGRYVLFSDADLATPIEEADKLLVYAKQGADVVIGSRGLSDSDIRVRQPKLRELMGRTFNAMVRAAVLGGIKDTQCGFKLFTSSAARAVFVQQALDGFAFDVEALLIARDLRLTVREVPVVWRHAPNSKVSPIVDSSKMFRDIVQLRLARRRRTQ
jgi:dolichyl-phosphate beta-glucosyltransferase